MNDPNAAPGESTDIDVQDALEIGKMAGMALVGGVEQIPQQPELDKPMDAVTRLASRFHDNWRSDRLLEDGTYEPRMKTTKDETWIAAHGTNEIDIANTDFADLPEDWRADNRAAAEVAQGALEAGIASGADITQASFVDVASNTVHEAWRSRRVEAAGKELDVPFDDLPENEKEKDRAHIRAAIELHQSPE